MTQDSTSTQEHDGPGAGPAPDCPPGAGPGPARLVAAGLSRISNYPACSASYGPVVVRAARHRRHVRRGAEAALPPAPLRSPVPACVPGPAHPLWPSPTPALR